MTFTTDARFVRNQAGIPAVVCGPGNIAQAHGIDEWVSISASSSTPRPPTQSFTGRSAPAGCLLA